MATKTTTKKTATNHKTTASRTAATAKAPGKKVASKSVKKATRTKKTTAAKKMTRPVETVQKLTPEERVQRIQVAAYLRAEQRGFAPGGEIEDWISAELEIDALQPRP